jgi:hypothetical protein|tara:strand:- start:487 stop:792 length:306 start_codon:yes stop_codon:yes gene_type:complete
MHKIITIIIFFSLSACGGGGGSDGVSKNVGETDIDVDNVYGDFADNVAADAAEEATALAAAAALQVSQEQATALAIAISDAEETANSNLFESATLGSSKFQ